MNTDKVLALAREAGLAVTISSYESLSKFAALLQREIGAENAELRKDRLADIRLSISHLGQIYGLIQEGKIDEASDYCRAAADSWTQDIDELSEAIDRARSAK